MQAQEIGIAIGVLKRLGKPAQDAHSAILSDDYGTDDGGVDELIKMNQRAQKWLMAK